MAEKDERYWDEVEGHLRGLKSQYEGSADFEKDVTSQQHWEDGIAYAGSREMKARLQQLHAEEVGSGKARVRQMKPRSRMMQWAAAAAILLLGVLAVNLWLPSSSVDATALYSDYYEPYSLDLTLRGQPTSSMVSRLEVMYNKGNYEGTLPLLEEALQSDSADPRLQLAQVMANWETGRKEQAKAQLEGLLSHPLLEDQARWYAALFAIQEGQTSQACGHLKQISDRGGKWYKDAKELIKKLAC